MITILLINFSLHIGVITVRKLLCFYIVTKVGKGNRSYLDLLDFSAASDAIGHDTLFVIFGKYVGITGSALQLLKSKFSDRLQRVLIDDVMSGVANLVCGVLQCSVLGPLKFCLYFTFGCYSEISQYWLSHIC